MKRIFKMPAILKKAEVFKALTALAAAGSIISLSGCGRVEETFVEYADTAMGTVIQMYCYTADTEGADTLFTQVMDRLDILERETLSWRLETSEVFRVNASAGTEEGIDISPDLADTLEYCLDVWEKSNGAFDITLGGVVRLWNIDSLASGVLSEEAFVIPSSEELLRELEKCGSEKLRLVERNAAENIATENIAAENTAMEGMRLYLPEGMQLDLGAVGKGIALNELHTLLESQTEITGAVISAGGSILVYGAKPDNSNWYVGIVNPLDTSTSIGTLVLDTTDWYITTSGDYERYVEMDGVSYHHIIDPATGYPSQSNVRGVTILTRDGLLGDALSTACFVLGAEEGLKLVEKYDAQALFVLADGEIVISDGLKEASSGVFVLRE